MRVLLSFILAILIGYGIKMFVFRFYEENEKNIPLYVVVFFSSIMSVIYLKDAEAVPSVFCITLTTVMLKSLYFYDTEYFKRNNKKKDKILNEKNKNPKNNSNFLPFIIISISIIIFVAIYFNELDKVERLEELEREIQHLQSEMRYDDNSNSHDKLENLKKEYNELLFEINSGKEDFESSRGSGRY